MDWTSIYAESGDEELLPPTPEIAPRMSRMVSARYCHHHHHHHHHHHAAAPHRRRGGSDGSAEEHGGGGGVSSVGHWLMDAVVHRRSTPSRQSSAESGVDGDDEEGGSSDYSGEEETDGDNGYTLTALYCLSINYILGVGCLGVPYAFARAGLLLGSALVVLVTLLSYVTVMWVAESMVRSWSSPTSTSAPTVASAPASSMMGPSSRDRGGPSATATATAVVAPPSSSPPVRTIPMTALHSSPRGGEASASAASERTSLLDDDVGDAGVVRGGCGDDAVTTTTGGEEPSGATFLTNQHQDLEVLTPDERSRYDREVIDLVNEYLGPIHRTVYQTSLLWLMYVGLLAYTQVFTGALSALLSVRMSISLILFSAVVVPLSCADLEEQVGVQGLLAAVRFVAIFVMVAGSVIALFTDDENGGGGDGGGGEGGGHHHPHPPYFAPPDLGDDDGEGGEEDGTCRMSYTACFSGFGVAFSTALFSQLFQHSVPGLLRPLSEQPFGRNRRRVPLVFGACLLTTCCMYLVLGTTAASYFGASTNPSVNLNFSDFKFGLPTDVDADAYDDHGSSSSSSTYWKLRLLLLLASASSGLVVVFPALDTLSVFPLIANTLGNNLLAASSPYVIKEIERRLPDSSPGRSTGTSSFFASFCWTGITRGGANDDRGDDKTAANDDGPPRTSGGSRQERKRRMRRATVIATVSFRLVAAIPPLLGSIWARDLSFSLQLAGVAGIYVAFVAPALLQRASCTRRPPGGGDPSAGVVVTARPVSPSLPPPSSPSSPLWTVYSGWYSDVAWTTPVLAFAAFALVVVLIHIRDAWVEMHHQRR